jgi:hypothetical protein
MAKTLRRKSPLEKKRNWTRAEAYVRANWPPPENVRLRVVRDKDWGEWSAQLYDKNKPLTGGKGWGDKYHADSKQDAHNTGAFLLNRFRQIARGG